MIITEKKFCIFALIWFCWHWGLLFFGLLPYPFPRVVIMSTALGIDAGCFLLFFYCICFRWEEIVANRWKSWKQ